ncbi:MAG: hypothetical protein CMP32_05360 [Rickettsiales bacterium]|nr:hypothetical protein [Rickettsiales bacterium]
MIIACNQPNYIPWYPYFHLIKSVDKFFLLDVVKAGKKNFIVRNKILDNNNKEIWLTIPLKKEEKYKNICHTYIDESFKKKHLKHILHNYNKSLDVDLKNIIENIYYYDSLNLHKFNTHIIKTICDFLKIKTKIILISEYLNTNKIVFKDVRTLLKQILLKEKCEVYLNFKNGIEKKIPPYDDLSFFRNNKIKLLKQNPNYCIENEEYRHSILNILSKKLSLPDKMITYERVET